MHLDGGAAELQGGVKGALDEAEVGIARTEYGEGFVEIGEG